MQKTRRFDIDFVAGICILHMMWTHSMQIALLTNTSVYQIETTLFSGYMAWFFFKSGMFFKKSEFRATIQKLAVKILLPYLVLSGIAICFELLYGLISGVLLDGTTFQVSRIFLRFVAHTAPSANLALWFLPCFFLVHMLFLLLQNKIHVIALAIIALVLGSIFDFFHLYRECFGGNVLYGLFFFSCGYIFKEKQYEMRCLVLAALFVVCGIFFPHYISAAGNAMTQGNFYPFGMTVILGKIFLVNRLCKNIPHYKSIFAFVGKNAMFCFCLHYFFLVLGKLCITTINPELNKWPLFWFITAICIIGLFSTHYITVKMGIRKYL